MPNGILKGKYSNVRNIENNALDVGKTLVPIAFLLGLEIIRSCKMIIQYRNLTMGLGLSLCRCKKLKNDVNLR